MQAAQEARQELDAGADATEIATAQAAVDKKRLAVSDAEAALAGTQLVAPFDGTILETNVSEGDQVTANTTILTLANLKTLQVVASVDETTIRQVSEGQDAAITFDAFPGQSFTGKVLAVPLQGTLQGDVMVYDVPLSLTGAEKLALRVGMTANVEIQVEQVSRCLAGADHRPAAIQRAVPGAGAQHDRSQRRGRGGAGGDWAERRHLHPDHQGPQRRRPGPCRGLNELV